jgi:hypothetical protein
MKYKVPESVSEIYKVVAIIIFFKSYTLNFIDKRQAAINNEYLLRWAVFCLIESREQACAGG